ncbi:MAG: SoxR reducing system RseC family protein [Bacteroidaceae bacterium]|nr:SoxR reducing system RseC family protein [Bacteroidaceae bacterium]
MNYIEHDAIVANVGGKHLKVRIVQTSACAGCTAKAICSSAEKRELLIDIDEPNAADYKVGDMVKIVGAASMGREAVMIAFVFPFVVLLASLLFTYHLTGGNQPVAGLVSLLSLVPTYFVIYLLRDKLKKKLSFKLKH